jgi:CTP:molybdopterin cytidylyltransferase MocA
MGADKASLAAGGATFLEGIVLAFRAAGLDPVLSVGRAAHGAEEVEGEPDGEMIDSLSRAIAALPDGVEACVIQPVDAPFTTPEMVARLLEGFAGSARVMSHRGAPGHPVLVSRSLFPAILSRPTGGLRSILAGAERVEWPDDSVLADLDTPDDLVRARRR